MSAARRDLNEQTLKNVNLEMLAFKVVIENDQADKLKALQASNNDAVTLQQFNSQKKNIELEYNARIQFLDSCKEAYEYIHSTHKRKLTSPFFRQFQLSEDYLADDMCLLSTTIRLTNQLISKPDESAETLTQLARHIERVDLHLQSEKKATKKKEIWLCVVTGLVLILSFATVLLTVGLIPLMSATLTIGAVFALCGAATISSIGGIMFSLTTGFSKSPRVPARKIAAICKSAESLQERCQTLTIR